MRTADSELTRRVVGVLRADSALTTLLFSVKARINPADDRIWHAQVELPEGDLLRSVLPRVLVESVLTENAYEQAAALGAVGIITHTFTDADDWDLGDRIDARVREVLADNVSDSRIASAELVPSGQRQVGREVAFNNAWRISTRYDTALAAVLQ